MKTKLPFLCLAVSMAVVLGAPAATLYVDAASNNALPPYSTWATAAAVIQDAVDAAAAGDEIVVTNGVYQSGAAAVYGMSNRVAVTKPITVRSVNGPGVTSIVGYQVPDTIIGPEAIRCVYLANGAVLAGLTLTNGATQESGDLLMSQSGGGVWCEGRSALVSNCVLTGNSAGYAGGGASYGTLNDCTLAGNSAGYSGGGTYCSTLKNCMVTRNSAWYGGGGASGGMLSNCVLAGNWVGESQGVGGGADGSALTHCTIAWNYADYGGGASYGTLNNCMVTGNVSQQDGGGAYEATLNHCTLTSNSASRGGGADRGTLNNCTLTGNSAEYYGGGAYDSTLNNCIVYYNSGTSVTANYYFGTLNYCCTTPLPTVGVGNITNAPAFVDLAGGNLRLQSNSPCINAGNNAYVTTSTDLDGHPPIVGGTVDIGAYEWQGPTRYVSAASTNPIAPYSSWDCAAVTIQDAVDAAAPGDEILVTNGVYQTGARDVYGTSNRVAVTKPITVRSFNGPEVTKIVGYQVPNTVFGLEAVRCVYLTNRAVLSGFTLTNGATQTSEDQPDGSIITSGGGVWCESLSAVVTNCMLTGNSACNSGGAAYSSTLNNCVLTRNSAGESGGGAGASTLKNCTLTGNSAWAGGGASGGTLNNCTLTVNRANNGGGAAGSALNDCTLTGNTAGEEGGGANVSTLNTCMITSNTAYYGGGAYGSTLNNCVVTGNSAGDSGGGARGGALNCCMVTGNWAEFGGGAYDSTLNNCTLVRNSAAYGSGAWHCALRNSIAYFNSGANSSGGSLNNYSCTTAAPGSGVGNITNEPAFVDLAGGDFRLQPASPCINAGNNADAPGAMDLDGNPRIVNGTVDIGAYEWQVPVQYAPLAPPGPGAMALSFTGETNRVYGLYGSSNLLDWFWLSGLTNLTGQATYTDPLLPPPPRRFYKAVPMP